MPYICEKTITQTYLSRVEATPKNIGFQFKIEGDWKKITYAEFHEECRLVSNGLVSLGIQPGDKVAILSNTRYEWALSDMAILGAGAITVPIYASNSSDDVAFILNHSEARLVIIEDQRQLYKIMSQRNSLKKLETIVMLDATAPETLSLDEVKQHGHDVDPARFEKQLRAATPEDFFSICYTSGTTGQAKGVLLTHKNMASVLADSVAGMKSGVRCDHETVVTFLPFSHILGRVESMCAYAFGWRVSYVESLDRLMDSINEVRPTLFFTVPRIFEKAYASIQAKVSQATPFKKKLFYSAVAIGKEYLAAINKGVKPSLANRVRYAAARKIVFNPILKRFGGRLHYPICGGAPLAKEIGEFFWIMGIHICEGYGLTETCAPVTLNTPERTRFGTVGRPMSDVSVRIAEDGEILLKSDKIFHSYYKGPSETAEALEDGWFHTGDIGLLDEQGFLRITDRKKDIIITSGGKNIAPQKIENLVRSQKFVSHCMVHGDRRNYLTALITLVRDDILAFASEKRIAHRSFEELVQTSQIKALIQKSVDQVNKQLSTFETIKKFRIISKDFTIESGELTPSLKIKRTVIHQKYKAELDEMYAP